jgi:hypothetical protein
MEKAYITKQTKSVDLCMLILAAFVLLLLRVLRFTLSAMRKAAQWAVTKHNFTPGDDEDPVTLTGAQYLCFALLGIVVVFVLSLKF